MAVRTLAIGERLGGMTRCVHVLQLPLRPCRGRPSHLRAASNRKISRTLSPGAVGSSAKTCAPSVLALNDLISEEEATSVNRSPLIDRSLRRDAPLLRAPAQ